jgi:hypothetical protein
MLDSIQAGQAEKIQGGFRSFQDQGISIADPVVSLITTVLQAYGQNAKTIVRHLKEHCVSVFKIVWHSVHLVIG